MTAALPLSCPGLPTSQDAPECSRPLVVHECLQRWRRETQAGVIDTGRYRCRHVAWGQGPPLVIIPGTSGDALAFVMLMARLQSSFRCISYHFPNGVEDGARLMSCTHDDLVADLFALLDHLKIVQCTLLGVSFGSTLALAALNRQPERFSRAILQGGFSHRPLATGRVPSRVDQHTRVERGHVRDHHGPRRRLAARLPARPHSRDHVCGK